MDRCRDQPAHKLLGAPGSLECSPGLHPNEERSAHSVVDRQSVSSGIHQPQRWESFNPTGTVSNTVLVLGTSKGNNLGSPSYCRKEECSGRSNHPGPLQLETENSTFPSAEHPLESIGNRFVCHSNIHPTTSFSQLETRTTSGSHKRLHARLVNCSGLCEPSLVSFNQMSEESSQRLSNISISHSPMVSPTMVSPSPTNDRGLPLVPTTTPRSNDTGSGHTNQSESSITTTTVGRLAHFRRSITSQGIPEEVEKLLSASWRSGTKKNYESAWGKWERWSIDQCVNPISATLNDALSFLTSQYQQGMSYRSINVYRSAILSIHPKIDDYLVGLV